MRVLATLAAAAGILLSGAIASSAEGVDELDPAVAERLYNPDMLDPAQPVEPSPLRDFKAKNPPPWKIGYASSYAGNTWRANAMDPLQNEIIPKWKELGLISEVVVTQSNLNDSTQIQQMRQLVDQGVDAIFVCCSNPTALNQTIQYAFDKGVPVFSMTGYLTAPTAINSSVNYQVAGFEIGKRLADELGGEGNVLVVEGIPGTSGSDSQDRGVKAGLATAPGIKVVGSIAGMWTDQVAQGEVQKWLATHPGKLDGIVVQSAAEMGVLRAIQQSGRTGVKVAIGGELGALCTWRKNPDLIAAADVLCYVGRLEPVLAASACRLKAGGLLAFSLERYDGPEPMTLRPSLRFAHEPAAVRAALLDAGFELLACEEGPLRHDRGAPVAGLFVLATKPAAPTVMAVHPLAVDEPAVEASRLDG